MCDLYGGPQLGGRHCPKGEEFELLKTVVLVRALPEYGLKAGDLGVVVELYEPYGLEVEFVTASGRTQAVVTLGVEEVKKPG